MEEVQKSQILQGVLFVHTLRTRYYKRKSKMAEEVSATLTLRNGECKEYKEVIERQSGQEGSKLNGLVKSLTKIQKDINDSLSELVEAERGTSNTTTKHTSQGIINIVFQNFTKHFVLIQL